MPTMLTDSAIKRLKSGQKRAHGRGLFIYKSPSGALLWRAAYRRDGKQRTHSFGQYPELTIAAAEAAHRDMLATLRDGKDPTVEKQRIRRTLATQATFHAVALELLAKKQAEGKSQATQIKGNYYLRLATPLHRIPVGDVTAPDVLAAIRPVERQGNIESAHKLRGFVGEVIRFAMATGRATADPTPALRGALVSRRVEHQPALLTPVKFGGLLRAIDGYQGAAVVKIGLQLLAHFACRPGELRHARWDEFDFPSRCWTIPASRMKMRREHRIPISEPAMQLLYALRDISTGELLLPSPWGDRSRPISENAFSSALRRMDFTGEHVSHGFRASFATLATESKLWSVDAIERALAHAERSSVRRAYQRSDSYEERQKLMAWWSAQLDEYRFANFLDG